MTNNITVKQMLSSIKDRELLPSVSIDNVIFGFHDGTLMILLNKFRNHERWMLPGGFIYINENVDTAAYRSLKDRTGLNTVSLTQFHLFGDNKRTNIDQNQDVLSSYNIDAETNHWFAQRFVSVGYYAFVEYSKVNIKADTDEDVEWFDLKQIPQLYSDHNHIIEKALSTIRTQIGNIPLGYELLPEKFTMTELRIVYEIILQQKLDRRNFQRKMLSTDLLFKLDEISKRKGIKSSSLFSFDKAKVQKAIIEGVFSFD